MSWDTIEVLRNGVRVAELGADQTRHTDTAFNETGTFCYRVLTSLGGISSTSSNESCAEVTGAVAEFLRGDADGNGCVDLADSIFIDVFLRGGPEPGCLDAADADDNGVIDGTDSALVSVYALTGAAMPPFPGPLECGADPIDIADALGCVSYTACEKGCEEEDGVLFRRGDPDNSGGADITDAIVTLDFLFAGADAPVCLEAADTNNDGTVDVSDPIHLLIHLFSDAPALAEPGLENCGPDPDGGGPEGMPDGTTVGCDEYTTC